MNSSQKRITRNRESLACVECRQRKLKCDRGNPCGSCIRRDDGVLCKYQRLANGIGATRERKSLAEAKLEHLEQLVQELSKSTNDGSTTSRRSDKLDSAYPITGATNGDHNTNHGGNGSIYTGPTHWSAMLDDIQELRDAILPPPASMDVETNGFDVLFGTMQALTYEETLAKYLPSRQEADRLVASYFKSKATMAPFLHTQQFGRLYESFWEAPRAANPLWTSILFSACHVPANLLFTAQDTSRSANHFSIAAAHCLIAGRYNHPQRFAIESLMLFLQVECLTSLDIAYDVGTMFGLAMRLATRMGYHRDPESLNISPFEKEMRRRTWSLAMQLDLLVSFQLGLPSNVQHPTWNTRPPASLMDFDFDEDTLEMPPERPYTTTTDITFYICKHRLMTVFEKILHHTLSQPAESSSELELLDAELRDTYAALPDTLQPRPMANSIVDPSYLKITRLCIIFIYDKCLCVLHRSYAAKGGINSVRICYQASTDLLRYFCDAYQEFQLGGPLDSERWFMGSITWNDFLLASMVLCVVLCVVDQHEIAIEIDHQFTTQLLQRSLSACTDQSARSKDTQRVKKVLEATISRLCRGSSIHITHSSTIADSDPAGIDTSSNTVLPDAPGPLQTSSTSAQPLAAWDWNEYQNKPIDDPSWLYLESFLQLPDDDGLDSL